MKIQTKRRGRILSARKSIIEQTKMRQGFERRLYKQMVSYFNSTGRQASHEIQSGRVELKGLEERLSQVLLPHYRSVIESFANRFVFTKQENQWERIIRNYITTQGGAKITRISGTTRNKINKIISDGQVEGFGVDKIAKNIRTQMSEPFTRYRSALIARTETHNASSYTNQAVAESYEVPMKKRWVSTNDDRTRSHHSAMNGVEVDIEADFDVPYKGVTYKMKHAGDPRGGPANVINCRCVILYVEPDDFVIDDTSQDIPAEKPVPTANIYGDTTEDEVRFHDNADWNKNTLMYKFIRNLAKVRVIYGVSRAYAEGRSVIGMSTKQGFNKLSETDKIVWRHEYGHILDYQVGSRVGSKGQYVSTVLRNELLEDRKKYTKNKYMKAGDETERLGGIEPTFNTYKIGTQQADLLKKEGTNPLKTKNDIDEYLKGTGFDYNDINDLYEGKLDDMISNFDTIEGGYFRLIMTALKTKDAKSFLDFGRFVGKENWKGQLYFADYMGAITNESVGYGHGKSYYSSFFRVTRGVTDGNTTEAMANYNALLGGGDSKTSKVVKKLMMLFAPETTKGFDDLYDRIEKNKFKDLPNGFFMDLPQFDRGN